MMRDIKFRGMSLNGWVYGYYVALPDDIGGVVDCIWQLGADDAVPVNSETIGQYTGLVDKNGTEIYEGDIVKVTDDDGSIEFVDGGIGMVTGMKDLYMWYIDGDVHNGLYDVNQSSYIEVIGNIYEHSHLLGDNNAR